VIYGLVTLITYYCYTHGGIEKSFKTVFIPHLLPTDSGSIEL